MFPIMLHEEAMIRKAIGTAKAVVYGPTGPAGPQTAPDDSIRKMR